MSIDWRNYKNFSKWEFDCKHTGENKMRPEFLTILQQIRTTYGKPMIITSGYRHWTHPAEMHKDHPGTHTYGVAADIHCNGTDFQDLFVICYGYGIRRFGIQQKGQMSSRYMHIDIGDQLDLRFRKATWTYP